MLDLSSIWLPRLFCNVLQHCTVDFFSWRGLLSVYLSLFFFFTLWSRYENVLLQKLLHLYRLTFMWGRVGSRLRCTYFPIQPKSLMPFERTSIADNIAKWLPFTMYRYYDDLLMCVFLWKRKKTISQFL